MRGASFGGGLNGGPRYDKGDTVPWMGEVMMSSSLVNWSWIKVFLR